MGLRLWSFGLRVQCFRVFRELEDFWVPNGPLPHSTSSSQQRVTNSYFGQFHKRFQEEEQGSAAGECESSWVRSGLGERCWAGAGLGRTHSWVGRFGVGQSGDDVSSQDLRMHVFFLFFD